MPAEFKILKIDFNRDKRWEAIIQKSTEKLGGLLEVLRDDEIEDLLCWSQYTLVLIDASLIKDLPKKISTIRNKSSTIKIIVLSPAPAYEQAKEVLKAGATDYRLKVSREEDVIQTLKYHLEKINKKEVS